MIGLSKREALRAEWDAIKQRAIGDDDTLIAPRDFVERVLAMLERERPAPPEQEQCAYCHRWYSKPVIYHHTTDECAMAQAPSPRGDSSEALIQEARTKYWDAPKGEIRSIIRRLTDALERGGPQRTLLTPGRAQHLARTHLYVDKTDSLGTSVIRGWDALATALDAEGSESRPHPIEPSAGFTFELPSEPR